jgi:prepilin-type N-terminal cleavage/methylation domain-containing protein
MQKKQKKAFTLVELIVVISILTILATIATIVVTSHISNARDGKRLTDLKTIQDNIEIFSMNKKLPMPDNAIDIKIGASTILYQWDLWKENIVIFGLDENLLDPLGNDYYTYAIDVKSKKFQILTMLENQITGREKVWLNIFPQAYAWENYSDRIPYVKWANLGIILDENNTPLQKTWTGIDISTITENYTAVLDTTDTITGTGNVIRQINPIASCKRILESWLSKGSKTYIINPDWTDFQVYCDMTTDWGGWTKIEYSSDLVHESHFTWGDSRKWLPNDFSTLLTKSQIESIQTLSTEWKQKYESTCNGVITYYYTSWGNYSYAFWFKFLNWENTNLGQQNLGVNFSIISDGCSHNNNSIFDKTLFEIRDKRVPIINISTNDNGDANEKFWSELTKNPAWLR